LGIGETVDLNKLNWALYGTLVRSKRRSLNYKKASSFVDKILTETGVGIKSDVLYRIEEGRQYPTATQFMAINMTLDGTLTAEDSFLYAFYNNKGF
jgi:hypothetical protein